MNISISGQTLIFTDIHFGLKNNSIQKLNICLKIIKEIIKIVKTKNIKNIIFGGDLFNNRIKLSVDTINIVIKCINSISKFCKVFLILGNHDIYNKNSVIINSLNIFKNTKNVFVIENPTEIILNNQKILLCPWLSDLTKFKENSYNFLIGHFDISMKYLITSYIEEHKEKNKTSNFFMKDVLENDDFLKNSEKFLKDSNFKKSEDFLGNFVNLVVENGTIFSGHIHKHKVFKTKKRNFIFIGSPYELTMGDLGNKCGYYILDEKNNYNFFEFLNIPKHIELKISEILNNNFDFNKITGNIIQRIYDVEIDRIKDSKIIHKILDYKPYEELIPRYEINFKIPQIEIDESLELIKKTKLEYIKNYIENIDEKILKDQNINKEILFKYLKDYYKKITNE